MKLLSVVAENSWKTEFKIFPLCAISHENWSWFRIYCELLWVGCFRNLFLNLWKTNFFKCIVWYIFTCAETGYETFSEFFIIRMFIVTICDYLPLLFFWFTRDWGSTYISLIMILSLVIYTLSFVNWWKLCQHIDNILLIRKYAFRLYFEKNNRENFGKQDFCLTF